MAAKKHAVRWRGVTLGEGVPKMAIPVMGRDLRALSLAARRAADAGADIAELRLDSLCPMPSLRRTQDACAAVRERLGERIPLLLTLRTARDGGAGSTDVRDYEALLCAAARARCCDALDCEISAGETAFLRIASAAHEAGVSLVGSCHAFEPPEDMKIVGEWIEKERAWGADVCKAAVMARDVMGALDAARAFLEASEACDAPIIGVCMGDAGRFTRVCAEALGSCITFATAGEGSAPGQLDARILKPLLPAMHVQNTNTAGDVTPASGKR